MEIKTKTTDYEMTVEVQSYLEEKLAAMAKLLADDSGALCEVTLGRASSSSRHGDVWFAEFNVPQTGIATAHAYARAESITAAIDKAKDELLQQLRREKKLHTRMFRKGGAAIKKLMRWE